MSTVLIPGVCQVCGCDEQHACPGGCSWIDEDRTLCSNCAGEDDE